MGRVQLDACKTRIDQHLGTPCKACNHPLDIFLGHGIRLPKLTARQPKLYGGRRLGMRVNNLLALPARMADLRPKMVAAASPGSRPGFQGGLHRRRGLTLYDDITWTLQMVSIDLHIARQQEPCTTVTP